MDLVKPLWHRLILDKLKRNSFVRLVLSYVFCLFGSSLNCKNSSITAEVGFVYRIESFDCILVSAAGLLRFVFFVCFHRSLVKRLGLINRTNITIYNDLTYHG